MARRPITAADLESRLKELLPSSIGLSSAVYRSCTPKYAREADLLNGLGSKRHGGRWNPPGLAAVYASLTPETAMAETLAHFRYYGIPIHAAMPRTFVAIDVRLAKVLDLTQAPTRRQLQVSLELLLASDWRKEV